MHFLPPKWLSCARFCTLLALSLFSALGLAQRHAAPLSEAEEEEVRDAAIEPARRIAVYQGIVESRVKRIQDVLANARAQGRRDDIRDSMESITSLVDELQDNLEEYDHAHRDLRKQLPKLLDAMPRWESVLRQPPDDPAYDLTRKLALEAVADVKSEVTEMLPAEVAYFKAHPPSKDADANKVGPVIGAERFTSR